MSLALLALVTLPALLLTALVAAVLIFPGVLLLSLTLLAHANLVLAVLPALTAPVLDPLALAALLALTSTFSLVALALFAAAALTYLLSILVVVAHGRSLRFLWARSPSLSVVQGSIHVLTQSAGSGFALAVGQLGPTRSL